MSSDNVLPTPSARTLLQMAVRCIAWSGAIVGFMALLGYGLFLGRGLIAALLKGLVNAGVVVADYVAACLEQCFTHPVASLLAGVFVWLVLTGRKPSFSTTANTAAEIFQVIAVGLAGLGMASLGWTWGSAPGITGVIVSTLLLAASVASLCFCAKINFLQENLDKNSKLFQFYNTASTYAVATMMLLSVGCGVAVMGLFVSTAERVREAKIKEILPGITDELRQHLKIDQDLRPQISCSDRSKSPWCTKRWLQLSVLNEKDRTLKIRFLTPQHFCHDLQRYIPPGFTLLSVNDKPVPLSLKAACSNNINLNIVDLISQPNFF